MIKFVLASRNPGKLKEMNEILSHLGIQVCSEEEAGVDVEVEETGTTFEENSLYADWHCTGTACKEDFG